MARRLFSAAVLVWTLVTTLHAQDYPAPTGKVNDFAGLLTASERTSLEAQLAEVERATSAEVAVVTVTSLGGRTVEEYATGLFHTWGIGKAADDNGVLVLVAPQERAMRIEVGYGLEGILPDGPAGAIIRETFLPRFRDGDYRTGILEGTARLVDIVRRHETLTPEQRAALDDATPSAPSISWGLVAVLAAVTGVTAFSSGAAVGTRVVSEIVAGGIFAAGAVAVTYRLEPRAMWGMAVFAVVTMVAGFFVGRRRRWRMWTRGNASDTWVVHSPASEGVGSSEDSSSGGDFGGGDSGGGGASGSW